MALRRYRDLLRLFTTHHAPKHRDMLPIPYATDRAAQRLPLATYGLVLVNGVVFLALSVSHTDWDQIYQRVGFSPQSPQIWTLLTSLFIHTDVWHLMWNMLYLWLFGSAIEDALEWWLFLLSYFACALAAHILYWCIATFAHWDAPTVGASGAIAGLLGLFAVRFYKTRIRFWVFPLSFLTPRWGTVQVSCLWIIGFFVSVNLFGGIRDVVERDSPSADWAHLGGFALGMFYGLLIKLHTEGKSEYLLQEARAAFEKGQWLQVLEAAGKVAQHAPENADAYLLLAHTYDVLRQPQRSLEQFKHAIAACWKEGDRRQGQRIYLEAVRAHPTFCLAPREQLSLVPDFLQAGEFLHAIAVLAKVVAYYPDTPEAETALLRAGQIYLERLNQPERALEMLQLLFTRYPRTVWRAQAEWAATAARQKVEEMKTTQSD